MSDEVLAVEGLEVRYGTTQVLFGVDLAVRRGEILALLGTNGAGKSTVLSAVTGLVPAAAGRIVLDGHDVTRLGAEERAGRGVALVPGGKGVFPTMTVRENLELAAWLHPDAETTRRLIEEVLGHFPVLEQRWQARAGDLSGGEQQMVAIAQALLAEPTVLLIDELSLGLAPVVVGHLLEVVQAVNAAGTTVVLVEQSVNVAATVADRAVFLEKGRTRFDGPTRDLLDRPDVLRAVFLSAPTGSPASSARRPSPVDDRRGGAPVLVASGLRVAFGGVSALAGVDLEVGEGEVVGLIGPNGAGKTTVLDAVSGFTKPSAGTVALDGRDLSRLGPDGRARRGLGRSFQDARLWPSMTVAEAIACACERHVGTRDLLAAAFGSAATRRAEAAVARRVEELLEELRLAVYADAFVAELSTGTRRMVDLACCLAHEPRVLLLDEPSSGMAQRETEALGPRLLELRERTGVSMVVVEHDMPLIQSISDRLIALEAGRVITSGPPGEVVAHPRVLESYLGANAAAVSRSGPAPRRARAGATT